MIGYWIIKYEFEDRSIGLVDYVSLKENEDIKLPVVSLCFSNPFFYQKIKEVSPNASNDDYSLYLWGILQGEKFERINYQNVTLDLGEYFTIGWKEDSKSSGDFEFIYSIDHSTTYNGYYKNMLIKCFSIPIENIKDSYIRKINIDYDIKRLIKDWNGKLENELDKIYFSYTMHYPEQFLSKVDTMKRVDVKGKTFLKISVDEIEILKRRSSRMKQCIDGPTSYDQRVIDHHIISSGCRVPYLTGGKSAPICNSTSQLKDSWFDFDKMRSIDFTPDCQILSEIRTSSYIEAFSANENIPFVLTVRLLYPERMRIITQSKEVDIHSLIGNIGGYIGLFLGNIL